MIPKQWHLESKQSCSNKASNFFFFKKALLFPFSVFSDIYITHSLYVRLFNLNFDPNYEVYLFAANLFYFMMETIPFYYRQKSTLKRQLIMRRLVGIITLA